MTSQRMQTVLESIKPFMQFNEVYERHAHQPGMCDFGYGNPHDMPLSGIVEALQTWSVPQNKDWFAYKLNEAKATEAVSESLRERTDLPFQSEDVFMTNGAFAALKVALTALVDPGDEVIFISPPWFFYEAMIASCGATPVRVFCDPDTFDLDVDAIENAITPRTRAVLVNSPHNPTGKIYPAQTLGQVARCLTEASKRHERQIYLLSDEAYSQIIYDERPFSSPAAHYRASLLLYTYGKTLLTPGQRLGYIALHPDTPEQGELRPALFAAQLMTGYAFPNALLQHALPDLEELSIDVGHLQGKRDRLVGALREIGYEVHEPEGTFYLLVDSPWADDEAFAELLIEHNILCLPGAVVEMPGTFRLSLTASQDMIERAIPRFEQAWETASAKVTKVN